MSKAFPLLCVAVFLPWVRAQERLPAGPGREALKKVCSPCHSAENVIGLAKSREDWGALVGEMAERGAQGTDDEFNDVVDYLTEHFPKAPPVNVNKATAAELEKALGFSAKESAAIVQYRQEKGNFKTADDLAKVPGLDAKKLQARKDRLAF